MKKILLALSVPYLLSAHIMSELFEALKNHSQTKFDKLAVQKSAEARKKINLLKNEAIIIGSNANLIYT